MPDRHRAPPTIRRTALSRLGLAVLLLAGPLLAPSIVRAAAERILVVVNDEPVTATDVDQRISLFMLGAPGLKERLQAKIKDPSINDRFKRFATKFNPQTQDEVKALQKKFVEQLRSEVLSELRPGLRDKALAELIGDRLKMQEARRQQIVIDEAEIDNYIEQLAKRNEITAKEFIGNLARQGIREKSFRERLRVQIAWRMVVQRKFRFQASAGALEIDEAVSTPVAGGGEEGEEKAGADTTGAIELQLQRVTFVQSGKLDQAATAARYEIAERLQQQAKGCNNMAALAKAAEGAKFESLGKVRADALPAEVRPLLLVAEKGTVTPPMLTSAGIEIYAVCERDETKAKDSARTAVKQKIETQKLAALSKGLLADLCAGAYIDYRGAKPAARKCGGD